MAASGAAIQGLTLPVLPVKLKSPDMPDKRDKSDYFVTMIERRTELPDENRPLAGAADPAGLAALIGRAARAGKGAAPVDRWNPPFCGDLDIAIRADGSWTYMGTPIGREAMVQLFSSVLRRDEDGKTYLVTPVEKVGICVEDAHFIAVEMDVAGEGEELALTFRTNVGDVVEAGPDHGLRFDSEPETGGLKPYLHVRGRLEALLSRAVTHQLADRAEEIEVDGVGYLAVRSRGVVFPIMPVADMAGA